MRHRTRRYLFFIVSQVYIISLISISNIDKTIENTSTSTRRVVTHAHVGHTVVYACKDGRRSTTIYTLKITYQKNNTHTPTHRIIFISSQPTRPRPRRASAVRDDARASRTRIHSFRPFALRARSLARSIPRERTRDETVSTGPRPFFFEFSAIDRSPFGVERRPRARANDRARSIETRGGPRSFRERRRVDARREIVVESNDRSNRFDRSIV